MAWDERRSGWKNRKGDARGVGETDYGRIVHSASFRRLQGKTQILNLGDSDFYRTRLTHSLEVAQVASSVTRQVRSDNPDHDVAGHLPDLMMIQAIGCTHDLGHPPFGHGGEVALNYCMRDGGGFEGNGQTLRILTKLEKFSEKDGSDLSRRTLLGALKYPVCYSKVLNPNVKPTLVKGTSTVSILDRKASKPPKCYMDCEGDAVSWILEPLTDSDKVEFEKFAEEEKKHSKPLHKSLDCSIMDLADDIAFGVHDFEDAVALRLVNEADFRTLAPEAECGDYLEWLRKRYPSEYSNNIYDQFVGMIFANSRDRKHAISRMVNYLVQGCEVATLDQFQEPLVRYRVNLTPGPRRFLDALISLVKKIVIMSPEVQHLEFKGQQMVVDVFEALKSEPEALLPRDTLELYEKSEDRLRVVCDHVAGMTDAFLIRTFERLFSPRMGSVFDKL